MLNLRLHKEIDADVFAAKNTELRDTEARLTVQSQACVRGQDEAADIAVKSFELSQRLKEEWLTAEYPTKRRLLTAVCLNCTLDDTNLVVEMRKPFDVLAKGLVVADSRGDRTPLELFRSSVQGQPATIRAALCQAATG